LANIKVNGVGVASLEGVVLKPNDRICLGASTMFLFKHADREDQASLPDTAESPITYNSALEEMNNE